MPVLNGQTVILILKIAVVSVTLIFGASLIMLVRGRYRAHGRINTVFFILTAAALLGLEVVVRIIQPNIFDYLDSDPDLKRRLIIHLCFALPATAFMPLMLFTGYTGRRRIHLTLAAVFAVLWTGTFVTGVFFLPHTSPAAL
jgi:uncharacterized membrane protein YozB (DUF420 family)